MKKNFVEKKSSNLSRFAWIAALMFFIVSLLPQTVQAQEKKLSFNGSFHVGSTYPLNDFTTTSDSNIHFRFDLNLRYQLADRVQIAFGGFLGFNQFTEDHTTTSPTVDNMYWSNLSLNGKLIWLVNSNYYIYVQAGAGTYKPKTGTNDNGYHYGGGFQVPIKGYSRLEFGIDRHVINGGLGDRLDAEFLTIQLGVIFPLFLF